MIRRLLCLIRPHVYRRARKSEDASLKYCKRCSVSAPVQKRKTKEQTA